MEDMYEQKQIQNVQEENEALKGEAFENWLTRLKMLGHLKEK